MSDDPLEEPLRSMATDYHQAPAPDRDAMWAAIQARRAAEAPKAEAPVVPLRRPRAVPRWAVPVGMAALLALAFGLGRLSRDAAVGTKAVATSDNPATPGGAKRDALVHQAAAVEYLGTVEVFLTDLPQAVKEKGRKEEVSGQARRLLATTRLLLDTPAGDDRRVVAWRDLVCAGHAGSRSQPHPGSSPRLACRRDQSADWQRPKRRAAGSGQLSAMVHGAVSGHR